MQENEEKTVRETELLKTLASLEDLAEKKTKIYSRLLTEATLAQDLEKLSLRHAERKKALEKLAFGKPLKKKKETPMYEMSGKGEGK